MPVHNPVAKISAKIALPFQYRLETEALTPCAFDLGKIESYHGTTGGGRCRRVGFCFV
jgi:hypothetical protein